MILYLFKDESKMHTGEISFCDKTAFNIKSDDTKRYILDRLEKTYGIKIIQRHFDKFSPSSHKTIQTSPHLVCVRSNGNPYFLYLMRYNFIQYCIFIDKKVQHGYFLPRMIIMQVHFNEDLFNDTLFEGEMVKAKTGKWYYVVNDVIAWKGRHLQDINLPKRLNLLYNIIQTEYHHDVYDPFLICVKRYFRYDEISSALPAYLEEVPYTVRGLYFRPLYTRFKDILYNFDDTLIKKVERFKYNAIASKAFILKDEIIAATKEDVVEPAAPPAPPPPPFPSKQSASGPGTESQSASFWVRKTANPDIYEMFDDGNKNVGIACIPSMKISKKMRELMLDKNLVDRVKLKFTMSSKFQKWVPQFEA